MTVRDNEQSLFVYRRYRVPSRDPTAYFRTCESNVNNVGRICQTTHHTDLHLHMAPLFSETGKKKPADTTYLFFF